MMCLLFPAVSRGQQLYNVEHGKEFEKVEKRLRELLRSEAKSTKEDSKTAEAAARYFIWRITAKSLKEDPPKIQSDFATAINNVDSARCDEKFFPVYGAALADAMEQVFQRELLGDPLTVVNASMMLPTLAKLKWELKVPFPAETIVLRHPAVVDLLLKLLEDPKKHTVVHLYALKALKECMPVRIQPEEKFDDRKVNAKTKEKFILDVKCVNALVKFIEHPINASNPDDLAVARYLRREAITALAQGGTPAVWYTSKKKLAEGPIAPTLLRVLKPNGLQPPASLEEKIEAAVGLCNMKYPNTPDYQPDLAVDLVGKTLVEFTNEYNRDWDRFAGAGLGGKTKSLPRIPWKGAAKRFKEGLKELTAGVAAQGKGPDAKGLELRAVPVLDAIAQYGQASKQAELVNFVNNNKPPVNNIWKGVP
jgi:hypothetical protein